MRAENQGRARLLLALGTTLCSASTGFGFFDNTYTNTGDGLWGTAGNWSAGIPTRAGNTSHTLIGGNQTVTIANGAGLDAAPWVLQIGLRGGAGTVVMNTGTSMDTQFLRLGRGDGIYGPVGNGNLVINGDAVTVETEFVLGWNAGGNHTVQQNSGTVTVSGNGTRLAQAGSATYTLSGGTLNTIQLLTAYNGGTTAVMNIDGGAVNAGLIHVGRTGAATWNHSAGTVTGNSWISIADAAGSTGVYNLSGSATLNATLFQVDVGARGNGTLNISGGSLTAPTLAAGNWAATGNGVINQTAGAVTVSSVILANSGSGTYNLEGGTLRTDAIDLNASGVFTWNTGSLATRSPIGAEGATDLTTAPGFGPTLRSGVVLDVLGDLDTTGAGTRALNLGGVYLNDGVRQNVLTVDGNLDLTGNDDTLVMGGSPYLLRPFGFNTEDYGTIPLVSVTNGVMIDDFEQFIAPVSDGKGWTMAASAPAGNDPANLALNTWWLEQSPSGVLFHYKVQGAVPEPSSLALLFVGGLFARTLRAQKRSHR